ncbi:MAG TPA: response regulator [Candidatus Berkiella sp.]|nr:response regulator [Candidatus Berkiella sp.]
MIRILTVDDSKSMRQMIAFTLESAGIEVIEKSDGLEAYEWAKQNAAPDLILADVNMPNMDGITLIKKLREIQEYKYIPILVLTTESSKDKKIQGKETGATGWIVKPFDPEQLINTINKVVGSKKQG